MRYDRLLTVAFPVLLVGMVAVERLATLLLYIYPLDSSAWISIELRSLSRLFSNWLDLASGEIFSARVTLLSLALLLASVMPIKGRFVGMHFLINHFALIGLVGASLISGGGSLAFAGPADIASSAVSQGPGLPWPQLAVMAAGLAGCAWCHLLMIDRARAAHAVISETLLSLSLGLDRRRPAARNSI